MTNATPKQRKLDARDASTAPSPTPGKTPVTKTADAAELARAQQRLAQDALARDGAADDTTAVSTLEQARALLDDLRSRIDSDPGAALRAHGAVSPDIFMVATAQSYS